MSVLITVLASVLVFGVVIALHEFGHFSAAKLSGIQVNEFSIGMGPAVWQRIWRGTQYSLRLLPLGGYVMMENENGSPASPDEQEEYPNPIPPEQRAGAPFNEVALWKRALVMAAGPAMNFILGFAVLLFLIGARQDVIVSRVIYAIEDGALCGQTGLAAGDEIVAVNGRRCFVANDILYELSRTQDARADFTVRRDGALVELDDVRFDTWQDEAGNTRMSLGFTVYSIEKTPASVIKEAFNSELYYGRIIFTSLLDLLRGRESINNLSGPVGIVTAIGQAASYGLADLLELLTLLTVNLGVFNLLPLPALDGGKLVFLAAEAVLRRPVPERLQGSLSAATFILLFGLMIFATYNDIVRLFTGAA